MRLHQTLRTAFTGLAGVFVVLLMSGCVGSSLDQVEKFAFDPSAEKTSTSTTTTGGPPPTSGSLLTLSSNLINFNRMKASVGTEIRPLTVTNSGTTDAFIGSISTSSPFSVSSHNCPIAPNPFPSGATCTVNLRFAPTVAGIFNYTLAMPYGSEVGTYTQTGIVAVNGTASSPLNFGGISSIDQITTSSARLNWTHHPQANRYEIYRVHSGTSDLVAVVLAPTSNYTVTSVPPLNTPLYSGTAYTFRVRAADAAGEFEENTNDVSFTTSVAGSFPAPAPLSVQETLTGSTPLLCSDTAGNTPVFAITGTQTDSRGGAGPNCSLSGSGGSTSLTCTPRFEPGHANWTGSVPLRCTLNGAVFNQTVTVTVLDKNNAPSLASISNQTVIGGASISPINGTPILGGVDSPTGSDQDKDGDSLTYSCGFNTNGGASYSDCSILSGSFSLNSGTGVLNWTTPSTPPVGGSTLETYHMKLTASDGVGGSDSKNFTIAVQYPPTITALSHSIGPITGGQTLTISGTGFDTSGAIDVKIGGVSCPLVSTNTATSLTCITLPRSAGSVTVVITNPNGLSATLANGYTYQLGPSLTSISPSGGALGGGTAVSLTGTGFLSGATVTLGGAVCTSPTVVSATSITCVSPAGTAGLKSVVVTNPDGQSSSLANAFDYRSAPVLTSLSISSGTAGNSITLSGTNFASGAIVTFGSANATVTSIASNGQNMTVSVPAGTTGSTVEVTVTNTDGQSDLNVNPFTYASAPEITGISQSSGPITGGQTLTITGTGFDTSGAIDVKIGGVSCPLVSTNTATSLSCLTPARSAGTVSIVVMNPSGLSATLANGYTYQLGPSLTSISPSGGALGGGTAVSLTGTGFLSGATVTLGGAPCTSPTVVSATSITCVSPAGTAGLKSVVVTNPDGQSSSLANAFDYRSAPVLTSLSISSGTAGNSITLSGTNFASGAIVTFGSANATVTSIASNGQNMTVSVPAGTTGSTVEVTVTNTDGQSDLNVNPFTYSSAPGISGITPNNGPLSGGNSIVISGSGFKTNAGGSTVTVGGAACNVTSATVTAITCTVAAHAAGAVNVVVTNDDGQSTTASGAYTYRGGPTLASVSLNPSTVVPAIGPIGGGTTIYLNGSNFFTGTTVTVGGLACGSTTILSSSQISCVTPNYASAATVAVTATSVHGQSGSLSAAFTYQDRPKDIVISPSGGSTIGGTNLVVSGSNFRTGASVMIGSSYACSSPVLNVSVTPNTITCTTPAGAAGSYTVTVTNADGQSGTSADGAFTYQSAPTITGVTAPAFGPVGGGTIITLSGSGFLTNPGSTTVTVGGSACYSVNVSSSTSLTCTVPPGSAGAANVVVINNDGQSATLTSGFFYRSAPTILGVTPSLGRASGGTSVTITGTNFFAGATATIGGLTCSNPVIGTSGGNDTLTCETANYGSEATVDVRVNTANNQQTVTSTGAFTYQMPPTISSVSPASGGEFGGTEITIVGTYFRSGVSVTIGTEACSILSSSLATPGSPASSITCRTAGGSAGTYALTVLNSTDNQSVSSSFFYTASSASQLTFVTQPSGSATAGIAFSTQPIIEVRDPNNRKVVSGPDSTAMITLSVCDSSGTTSGIATGSMTGSFLSAPAVAGVANFTTAGLKLLTSGNHKICATKASTSGTAGGSGSLSGASSTISVSPDVVSLSSSTFNIYKEAARTTETYSYGISSSCTSGSPRYGYITVVLRDAYLNPITNGTVTVSASTGGTGWTLSGTPSGRLTVSGTEYRGTLCSTTAGTTTLKVTEAGSGDLTTTRTVTIVPLLQFTTPSDRLPPITGGINDPLVQGTSSGAMTPSSVIEIDGLAYTFSCTYDTPAMGSSDSNFVSSASNTPCTSLPSYNDSNGVNISTNASSAQTTATFNSVTGALTWIPRWDQRGVYRINLTMTSANGSLTKSYHLAVREPWSTTRLAAAFDAALSTGFTGYSGIPFAPAAIQSNNSSTNWLGLLSSFTGVFSAYTSSSSVWQGTGAASISSVSPYSLNLQGDGTKIDSMDLGSSIFNSSTDKTYLSLWVKPNNTANTGRVIASNRALSGGYSSGLTLRQSTSSGKIDVIAEPFSYLTELTNARPARWWRFEDAGNATTSATFADSCNTLSPSSCADGNPLDGTATVSSGASSAMLNQSGLLINESSKGMILQSGCCGVTTFSASIPSDALTSLNAASQSNGTGWAMEFVFLMNHSSVQSSTIQKYTAGAGGWRITFNASNASISFSTLNASGGVVQTVTSASGRHSTRNIGFISYDPSTQILTVDWNPTSTTTPTTASMARTQFVSGNTAATSISGTSLRFDELAFFNRPLTLSEMLSRSNAVRTGACTSTNGLINNDWNHIAATTTSTAINLFINGRLESSCTITGSWPNSGANLRLGNFPSTAAGASTSTNFNGEISDVRVYNQGTSDSQTSTTTIVSDFVAAGNRYRQIPIPNIVIDSSLVFLWDAANSANGLKRSSALSNGSTVQAFDFSAGSILNLTLGGAFAGTASSGWIGQGTSFSPTEPYSLMFDNSNDVLTLAANSLPSGALSSDPNASFSASVWMRLDPPTSGQGTIFTLGASGCCGLGGFQMMLRNAAGTSPIQFLVGYGAGGTKSGTINATTASILDGKWHHVVVTYSGSTKLMRFYMDGTIQTPRLDSGSGSVSGTDLDLSATTTAGSSLHAQPLNIGLFLGSSNPLKAPINALALYNKALTQSEIRQNCLAMRHRFPTGAGTPNCAAP